MPFHPRLVNFCVAACVSLAVAPLAAHDTVLSQAVVHLSFDEDTGPAFDSGKASQHPDNGTLVNDPVRVASPFGNQSGKKALLLDANTLSLIAGQPNKVIGTVKRTAPFAGKIDVSLNGLPNGYSAPKALVPPNKEQFELVVTAAAETAAKDIPNISLRVEATGVGMILPDSPVALKVILAK